jgi:uncharacterized protein YqgC (DUF456 family)
MPIPWLHTTVRTIVLIGLIITWIGTLIPIFPAPTVMWGFILLYGITTGFETRGWILFAIITVLTIISTLADNFFTIRGARQGGARWASVAIASVVGFIAGLMLTPIGGILVSVGALFAAETAFTHNTEKAWEATKQWLLGWGWATAVRLAIGFVALTLWVAWAWL